jgi:hypothetical protein
MVATVADVKNVAGSDKPARVPQEVLTIVAQLVSSIVKMARMAQMGQMAQMGAMDSLAA